MDTTSVYHCSRTLNPSRAASGADGQLDGDRAGDAGGARGRADRRGGAGRRPLLCRRLRAEVRHPAWTPLDTLDTFAPWTPANLGHFRMMPPPMLWPSDLPQSAFACLRRRVGGYQLMGRGEVACILRASSPKNPDRKKQRASRASMYPAPRTSVHFEN